MQKINKKNKKRILAFRNSSLGDVAMCVPVVIKALEQNDVCIDFICPAFLHCLFPKHERLKLIDFDKKNKHKGLVGIYKFHSNLKPKDYFAFADLHNVLRSQVLKYLLKIKGIYTESIDKDRKEKKLLTEGRIHHTLKHTTERYADVFRKLGLNIELNHALTDFHKFNLPKSNAIGVAPFAAHSGKMYDIDKMKQVIEILQKSVPIIIFGSQKELNKIKDWQNYENVSLSNKSSIRDELKLISTLNLMVSMDSANMHFASLVGVPVISIWGVTHPNAGFLGYGQTLSNVIQDETADWRPNSIYGNKPGPEDNTNGMKNISPEIIVETILSHLK